MIQVLMNVPNANAVLQINILNFDTDKKYYCIDENIKIEASWILNYNPIEEWAYIQMQIFDSFNQLLWCSEQNDSIGVFDKNWTVEILSLNFSFFEYKTNFSIVFYLFHMVGDEIFSSGPITMKTIQILKRLLSCSLLDYSEKIYFGESINFQGLFYNISNNITVYPDNLLVTLNLYKEDILIYNQEYYCINGLISVNISTLTFSIIGGLELNISTSTNSIYSSNIFIYNLEVQKLDLNYSIHEFTENLNYKDNIVANISFFTYSDAQILYCEMSNISVKIYSNSILVYENYYNSSEIGNLFVIISSEIFESDGEKLIYIDIFNNSYYNDLSIKLSLNLYNYQKLDLNYSIHEFTENLNYKDNIVVNISFFTYSNDQILYCEILNISVKIYSNNILVYENYYNSSENGNLFVIISSEIFESDGEKLIYIDIFNNSYYNDLSIKLSLNLYNYQTENLFPILSNMIFILIICTISGVGALFIVKRKRKFNKSIFDITFKY